MGGQKDKKGQKDKLSKEKKDKLSKSTKLQLKGRIFMTNVTDVLSLVKPGLSFNTPVGNSSDL